MRPVLLTAAFWLFELAAAAIIGTQPAVLQRGPGRLTVNRLARRAAIMRRAEGVKPGTELRILCTGDSITLGTLSDTDGGDGNGYRLRLRDNLSHDHVVFAGMVTWKRGTMTDGYFAAWPGKTIQYIADHIEASLRQWPNLILLHAGTNDMNPDHVISTEGNDPAQAVKRLGALVDRIVAICPDAVVLVAMIIDSCKPVQAETTREYQTLIPAMVQRRYDQGQRVLAANLTSFPTRELKDYIHPTNRGYRLLGDYWRDFISQIPRDWIQKPVGPDPHRLSAAKHDGGFGHSLYSSLVAAMTVLVGHGVRL